MAISKENVEKTIKAMQEHKQKMETDPTYRAESEKLRQMLDKKLLWIAHEDEA